MITNNFALKQILTPCIGFHIENTIKKRVIDKPPEEPKKVKEKRADDDNQSL